MKKNNLKRGQIMELLFNLTDSGTNFRNRMRNISVFIVWLALSGLTMMLTVFSAEGQSHRMMVIGMSLVKYVPMIIAVFSLSRRMAAKYLNDIYELENEEMAENFLTHVAFDQATSGKIAEGAHLSPLIIIEDGEIKEIDELSSQLILIGGPGYIQVNLDSAALLEKVNGETKVIYPSTGAWRLGCFERIREISESDLISEREYAIINLREQRIKNIRVKARTKDGVPVEARDVKIKFSVLRDENENDEFSCKEKAVEALVYQQTTITPESKVITGVGFPWNTTVIPLVISEIEKVISSHTADEIAVGIGQKELELNADIEKTAAQARVEMTGKHNIPTADAKNASVLAIESREKINNQFYEDPFKSKAAAMGVRITWIDIGTWQPVGTIRDKIRGTWSLARENLKKHNEVKKMKQKHETAETLNLIDSVINPLHERLNPRSDPRQKEKQIAAKELQEMADRNPNFIFNSSALEPHGDSNKKGTAAIARDMLKAFRKELLVGKSLLEEKETTLTESEKHAETAKIETVLQHINQYFPVK